MDSRVLFDSVGDDVAITDTKDAATESAGVNNTESNTDNAKKTETVSEKDGQGKKWYAFEITANSICLVSATMYRLVIGTAV